MHFLQIDDAICVHLTKSNVTLPSVESFNAVFLRQSSAPTAFGMNLKNYTNHTFNDNALPRRFPRKVHIART